MNQRTILMGGLVALAPFAIYLFTRPAPPVVKPAAARETFQPSGAHADDNAALLALRRRLDTVESRVQASQPAAPSASAVAAEEAPPPDAAALTAEELRKETAAYVAEAPDPRWATQAAQSLSRGLAAVAERGRFSVVSVECKTSLCRANLRWNSYSEATANFTTVVQQTLEPNCIQKIWVPEPADADAPYEASTFFDCTEVRAGG